DWFNALDLTLQSNRWGLGLPPAWKNFGDWDFWRPRLATKELEVSPKLIRTMRDYVLLLIKTRKSSPLFRMTTLEEVQDGLMFLDSPGLAPPPGVIAYKLKNPSFKTIDPDRLGIIVIHNPSKSPSHLHHQEFTKPYKVYREFAHFVDQNKLHPIINYGSGAISVPPRSTTILELLR
ncbi:MAG: DUF3372 domain-containing protein, partial [Bdellovibrionaceae bacterium]|nr:DUF3372 domain-containing protein [Pseudobdellovibrionaceae bacterium]